MVCQRVVTAIDSDVLPDVKQFCGPYKCCFTPGLIFSSFPASQALSYPYTSHTYAHLVVTLVTVSVSVPRMSETLQYNRQRLLMLFWRNIFLIGGIQSKRGFKRVERENN